MRELRPRKIGVLALQGDFKEHAASLRDLGAELREVRTPGELREIDALVIPGGESTTIARLLLAYELHEPIRGLGARGFPIWGTCAGAIMLGTDVRTLDRPSLGLLPMTIDRNAYGRQVDSFEADLDPGPLGGDPLRAIFIRAPRIRSVEAGVSVLLELEGEPVAVRYGSLLATTFHPELSGDSRMHAYFLDQCVASAEREEVARDVS